MFTERQFMFGTPVYSQQGDTWECSEVVTGEFLHIMLQTAQLNGPMSTGEA